MKQLIHPLRISLLFWALLATLPLTTPAQLGSTSNAPAVCGMGLAGAPAPLTLNDPTPYYCNGNPTWPSCGPIRIPVAAHFAGSSNGLFVVGPSQINGAILYLNSRMQNAGFQFYIAHRDTIFDDNLYLMENEDAGGYYDNHHIDNMIDIFVVAWFLDDGILNETGGLTFDMLQQKPGIFVRSNLLFSNALTHEMGHLFGLLHTFETRFGEEKVARPLIGPPLTGNSASNCINCGESGDLLCGTDADDGQADVTNFSTCEDKNGGKDNCGNEYQRPVSNYMGYTDFNCGTHFTPDQIARMRCWYKQTYEGVFGSDISLTSYYVGFNLPLDPSNTDYMIGGVDSTEGTVEIGSNAQQLNQYFSPCTGMGAGQKMLVANGATVSGLKIWKDVINVLPHTWYKYEFWATSVYPKPFAQLQVLVNGVAVTYTGALSNTLCTWQKFTAYWWSGDNCSTEIAIRSASTAHSGNDVAIDEIRFNPSAPRNSNKTILEPSYTTALPTTIKLYPNPGRDHVEMELEMEEPEFMQWSLIDLKGQTVYTSPGIQLQPGLNKLHWERPAGIANGLYMVRIQMGQEFKNLRLMLN